MRLGGIVLAHWSKTQASVALSSAEAEFNSVIKSMVEGISVANLDEELWQRRAPLRIHTDASACKGMLLRTGAGKLKHMSTKQLWAQGAVESYGAEVVKVPRAVNSSDAFTHVVSSQELHDHLLRMGFQLR